MTELEGFKLQYETEFDNAVKDVVNLIAHKSTQQNRSDRFDVSLRTIQNFEIGKSRNYWLLFCYRMDAFGDAIV